MKYLVKILLIVLCVSPCFAQTVISATITDSDSISWVGGTWKASLYNPSSTQRPVYTNTGLPVQTNFSGVLNSSGAFTQAIPDNTKISPSGTRWIFTFCSATPANCSVLPAFQISGASENLSSLFNTYIIVPRFACNYVCYGYNTVEVSPTANVGTFFFNTTTDVCYQMNNTLTFQPCGGASTNTVSYNPSTSLYVFTGESRIGDDTAVLGSHITVTAVNCNGTVCIFTNTGNNGLIVGDWIFTGGPTIGITSPSFLSTPVTPYSIQTIGQGVFQVLSTGLTSTSFEIAYTAHTGTGTGGVVENANHFLPFETMAQPFFKGHGSVNTIGDSTETIIGIASDYHTLFHSISPAVTGNTNSYLIINGDNNSLQNCTSLVTIETAYQSLWQQAHNDGWIIIQNTTNASPFNSGSCPSVFSNWANLNTWLRGQSKNISTVASGLYWDRLADIGASLTNPTSSGDEFLATNGGYGPGGVTIAASVLNDALSTQSSIVKSFSPLMTTNGNGGMIITPSIEGNYSLAVTHSDGNLSTPVFSVNSGSSNVYMNQLSIIHNNGGDAIDVQNTNNGVIGHFFGNGSLVYYLFGEDTGTNDFVSNAFTYNSSGSSSNSYHLHFGGNTTPFFTVDGTQSIYFPTIAPSSGTNYYLQIAAGTGQVTATNVPSGGSTPITCSSNNCYYVNSDGTIVEWGTGTTLSGGPDGDGSVTITLPKTMTTGFSATCTTTAGYSHSYSCNTYSKSTSGFHVYMWDAANDSINNTFDWIVVGH